MNKGVFAGKDSKGSEGCPPGGQGKHDLGHRSTQGLGQALAGDRDREVDKERLS